ncbi:CPBP family intramembrane metalloprotease [Clostridium carnis]
MKEKFKSFFIALGLLAIAFCTQLVVSLIAGVVIAVSYIVKNGTTSSTAEQDIAKIVFANTSYILLIASVITISIFIIIYKVRKKRVCEEILLKSTKGYNILLAVILGISVWLINSGILSSVQNAGFLKEYFESMEKILAPLAETNLFVSILVVGIVAPFAEEFLFRGVIYKALSKNISIPYTIIIQGILFGIYHGNLIQGVYATFLGIVFGYVTYKTKSLVPAIIIHMVNNTVATVAPILIGENLNTTLALSGAIVIGIIGTVLSLLFINKKNRNSIEVVGIPR